SESSCRTDISPRSSPWVRLPRCSLVGNAFGAKVAGKSRSVKKSGDYSMECEGPFSVAVDGYERAGIRPIESHPAPGLAREIAAVGGELRLGPMPVPRAAAHEMH